MNQQYRKVLTSRMYSLIFRKILPDLNNGMKIGQTEHSRRINAFSRDRQRKSYDYQDLSHLELKTDSSAFLSDFDGSVKENNFINWINGTSSPKNLVIINSILEYVMETCRDEDKRMLLKYEVLQLLKSDAFSGYTEHLIDRSIQRWIERIGTDDRDALFMAVRNILYLLKNKPRFIQFILSEEGAGLNDQVSPFAGSVTSGSESAIPESGMTAEIPGPTVGIPGMTAEIPGPIVGIPGPIVGIPGPIEFGHILDHESEAGSSTQISHRIPHRTNIAAGVAVILCILVIAVLLGSMDHPGEPAANSVASLFPRLMALSRAAPEPPEITMPLSDSPMPRKNIDVRWKPADRADSYTVAVTDTDTWEQILLERDVRTQTFTLSRDYIHASGNYRIYVLSSRNGQDSEPNFVDIAIQPVNPPILTSPRDVSMLDLTDILLEWEPVEGADGYGVNVFEFSTWTSVFSKSGITGSQTTLQGSLFHARGRYRVFVNSMADKSESVPNYIDITFK